MRLLVLLLLFAIPTFAQKTFNITDEHYASIAGASVFLVTDKNSLIAVSDERGFVSLNLKDDQKYLFHCLGYVDTLITSKVLSSQNEIILKLGNYALKEVVINKSKFNKYQINKKPGNYSIAEANNVLVTFERVVPLEIKKAGFINEFRLFAHKNFEGEVRVFRFILFTSELDKPGKSLVGKSVLGILKGGKMIFNLKEHSVFLEKGRYYIGYETVNSGKIDPLARTIKSKFGTRLEYPMIFIKGKSIDLPASFSRTNLKNWYYLGYDVSDNKEKGKKVYVDFGYELEMLINQ